MINFLKKAEDSVSVAGMYRQHRFSRSTFHQWQTSYGGMDAAALRRLRKLEQETTLNG